MNTGLLRTIVGATFAVGLVGPVLAADTGPSTPAPTPAPTQTKTCPRGQVYDTRQAKCVAQKTSQIDDDALYDQGRQLAKVEERYEDAIAVLSLVQRQDDPRVWNFLGYSHRKLGDVDRGVAYYYRALMLKPDYSLVREYLGEAYVQKGRLDLAKEQLAEIVKECGGTACEPYEDLAEEIAAAEKARG